MAFVDDVFTFLGTDGPIAELLFGFQPRKEQLEMAAEVARTLENPGHRLVVEAGTGTGKSLAYLVPAVLSGKKVLISTGTKALQDQLFEKDIPLVLEALRIFKGVEKTAVLMKGRANYLCLNRFDDFLREPLFAFVDDARHLTRIEKWVQQTDTGDRAEIDGLPDFYAPWADMDASSESCIGRNCSMYQDCFITRMRHDAESADLIVANHHLVCADLRLRLEGMAPVIREGVDDEDEDNGFSFAKVLPDVDCILVDEAHTLPDVATSYFGVAFAPNSADRLSKDLRKMLVELDDADASIEVGDALADVNKSLNQLDVTLANASRSQDRVRLEKNDAVRPLQKSGAEVEDAFFALAEILDAMVEQQGDDTGIGAGIQALKRRAEQLGTEVGFITGEAIDDERFVSWVEQKKRGCGMAAAPIDVSDALRKTLFSGRRSVVLTSATLAVGTSTFAYEERVGLLGGGSSLDNQNEKIEFVKKNEEPKKSVLEKKSVIEYKCDDDDLKKIAPKKKNRTRRLLLSSPFSYEEKAALYAPKDMPAPNASDYLEHFDDEVKHILSLAKGGTLLLFTSHKAMQNAFERLQSFLISEELEGLIQGDAPKLRLLERMKELDELSQLDVDGACKGGVLFATQSFWEGVDLRGRTLRAVVIDKLPFKSPKDPINQARLEMAEARGKKPFFDLSVPEAAILLKQGAGRLLRDVDDAGIVAILDGRLRQKSYGRIFLNALPPFIRIGSQNGLERFWRARVKPWLDAGVAQEECGE